MTPDPAVRPAPALSDWTVRDLIAHLERDLARARRERGKRGIEPTAYWRLARWIAELERCLAELRRL